jgi:hypothetical protein
MKAHLDACVPDVIEENIVMKQSYEKNVRLSISSHHPRYPFLVIICIGTLFTLLLSACSSNGSPGTNSNTTLTTTTSTATAATTTDYPVKVYFSKSPTSLNSDPSTVYPVDRVSPTLAVGAFSIQLLIAGPTPEEQKVGYFTELNTMLSGPSKCSTPLPVGGPDFTLTLDKRGTVMQKGMATLQFCRSITSSGIGADARVKAEINATLKQFSTITGVVILTQDGHCFGDESGMDSCLK